MFSSNNGLQGARKCSKEHEISGGPSWWEEGEQMASGKIASELTRVSTDCDE